MLTRGANPLITDAEGNIALHWAALAGSRHTCELLINAGCDVNATNSIGETPIHIALRQDHYECVVLLLMRKARLDIRNQSGQLPQDCMVSKDVQCTSIVNLSTTLQNMMKDCKQSNVERIVCNDLTHAKETNPIQCVNSIDDAKEPEDYVYVSKNCVTSAVPIDTNISKLQVRRSVVPLVPNVKFLISLNLFIFLALSMLRHVFIRRLVSLLGFECQIMVRHGRPSQRRIRFQRSPFDL